MKRTLPFIAICLVQFIFGANVFAQKFELTPRIQAHEPSNKSSVFIKEQSKKLNIGNALSVGNKLKSGNTSQFNYSWGKYFSTSYDDSFYKTVIDAFGNVIAVGAKGEGSSDVDAVIYKYDSSGKFLWSDTPAKSSDWDGIYGVVSDVTGNIYVTGEFYYSAFNDKIYSNGNGDVFIAKYKADGTLLWAKNAGGSSEDYGSNIALDAAGNIYIVGYFNGTSNWDGIYKTSSAQGDMFIAKYDNNGNVKWVRNGNIGENNWLHGIGVDKSGNVYVSAFFEGDIQFEGSSMVSSNGGDDIFLIKYDNLGNYKWIKTTGGTGNDGGNDTSVDVDGNIIVAGYFSNTVKFEDKILTAHGTFDIFCAKYSPSGNLIWVKQFGGTGSQTAWTVASDEKSNCYLSGWFSGTGAFDNSTITSTGGTDAYLIKYDKNGNLIWVEPTATGVDKQVGSGVFVKVNDIAVSGYYEGEMYIQGSNFPNSGGEDAYLAKLTQADIPTSDFIVNPSFSLSSPQIKQGQSITITSRQFSPVGKYDLQFSGPGKLTSIIDGTIDVNGNFQKTLTTLSTVELGDYTVTAIDKISGKTYSQTFRIISNQTNTVDTNLIITEPNSSKARYTNEPILFAWKDKVKFNVNTAYNKRHSYSVSVQKDNGAWQLITKVEGTNNGFGDLFLSINYTPTQPGKYKLKVEDNYYPNRSAITPEITIENPVISDILIERRWDKSYPIPKDASPPKGVAADGVARFYIVISNTNLLTPAIQKVKISLSDPNNYMAPRYLGKVKYCATQNDNYTTPPLDANDISTIVAENNSSNLDGKYWFWYVAPEDFSRNKGDWTKDYRTINVNIEITLIDQKKYTKQVEIEIVRPPLFLVHGLNGDLTTWDNFRIGVANPIYNSKEEKRFKIIFVPQMEKTATFDFNSNILLDGINNERSFRYWIYKLREQGYACNQVDYICHSMGGSMLRNAVEYSSLYYRNSNYKKGFVHKFITLNTPHQGSSLANLLDDICKIQLFTGPLISLGAGFANLFDVSQFPYKVVDAVSDLKYKGGKKFGITQIPSHLIGSGVSCREFNTKTFATYELLKTYLGTLTFTSFLDQCNWFNTYFKLRGYENNFMDGNDAIVSLTSQFSGNIVGTLPSYCTPITGPMHNSIFGESPAQSVDVFNKVDELLNSDGSSPLFGYPQATVETKSANSLAANTVKIIENKISILYPSTKPSYNAGDTMMIKLKVDTVGLKSFSLYFQNQGIYTMPSSPSVVVNLTVNPEQIEGQNIVVIGNYHIAGQASLSTASKDIKVNPVGSIMEFNVKPEVVVLQKGKSTRPEYEAIFPNAISNIGITDLLAVTIKDPTILSHNSTTNSFNGITAGITNATINYRGKSKTVFFEILQPVTPTIDPISGIDDIEIDKKNQLNVKTYPNPFSESLTFEYSLPENADTKLEIYDLYGRKVKDFYYGLQSKGSNSETIDLNGLAPGIYIYKLISGKVFQNGSIVKVPQITN